MFVYANNKYNAIYKQWHNINVSNTLYMKYCKKFTSKKTYNHHVSPCTCVHTHTHTCTHHYKIFWIMREWLKSSFSSWKSWGKFSSSITQNWNGKKSYFRVDSWLELHEGLSPTKAPRWKRRGKEYKLHEPRKNCFWIVVVNSIMLCDSSHLYSSRLF